MRGELQDGEMPQRGIVGSSVPKVKGQQERAEVNMQTVKRGMRGRIGAKKLRVHLKSLVVKVKGAMGQELEEAGSRKNCKG